MPTIDKKDIALALREAMNREELHNRQAALYLNLNPCYVSMALNPKSWDSMSKDAWIRLQEWFEKREPLSEFKIPKGEEIWKPNEKVLTVKIGAAPTPNAESIIKAGNKLQKEIRKKFLKKKAAKKVVLNVEEAKLTPVEMEFRKEMKAHDERVFECNNSDLDFVLPESEPMRIPITLDLKINIEVQLFGKTINIAL